MIEIFQADAPGISLSATSTASAEVALPTKDVVGSLQFGTVNVRIVNEGPNIAFVHIGKGVASFRFGSRKVSIYREVHKITIVYV